MSVVVYTDGASRGNPGLAGVGVAIFDNGVLVQEERKFLGEQTNNWAEYEAVAVALEALHKLKLSESDITFRLDSKLVAEQLSGNWKIKKDTIQQQYDKIQKILESGFSRVTYTHVPRADNAHADRLANEAIDNR